MLRRLAAPFAVLWLMAMQISALAADTAPLTVDAKIPLGKFTGRIDHLAYDPTRARLYVAELGEDSIGIVGFCTGVCRHRRARAQAADRQISL